MNDRKDNVQLHDEYIKNRHIHIKHFLKQDSALYITQKLEAQKTWNLSWNNNGTHTDMNFEDVEQWSLEQQQQLISLIHEQAKTRFQYLYASIPVYDICANSKDDHGFFSELYNIVNSIEFIDLCRHITGCNEIQFADIQATRYSKGHFLKEHDDNVSGKGRIAAYVLNLTPNWQEDWGGALILNSEKKLQSRAFFPSFNALNIFEVPQRHSVSLVTPFAGASRFSLTGWLRK